ncbi:3-oxoacyl-[acyl-carrier protein] reductase [Micromonospora kangleipakensis]|uniref:3-oxoacyl-[acyl-carrier protein] reductase n=1 Tax=Micromonospora kangleipakensis TaxID=1077942 RepID=A0A4V2GDV5_9ACTN|nr:3-oxoacyl-ACP reductase family protein [Micromonospora kangleipakensis]RZU77416.1 3-oxoacyl-[acyl-carrier protein] reductase [Micromonospora kangleipakensis]
MTTTLDGKVALVTGGSRGIGAGIALRLATEGADVALTYQRDDDRAALVVKQIEALGRRVLAVRADSADPDAVRAAVDRTVEELGRLDILVNNAAVFLVGPVEQLGPDELERTLAVNVRAPYVAAQAAARHMTGGGRIINIGSNVARRAPFPGLALYSMSKTALVGLTKGLGRELGPRGITVNLVNPGPTDTDANPADGPNAAAISGLTALGRYAVPAEIAGMVAHLAGVDGGYVTGASIDVDGGFAS